MKIQVLVFKLFLIFTKTVLKHFPLQTQSRRKSKQNHLVNIELDKMQTTRDKNKIKFASGTFNLKEYKEHKNKARKMTRKAQKDYYKNLFNEKQNGMK